jgi:hypothetical protein
VVIDNRWEIVDLQATPDYFSRFIRFGCSGFRNISISQHMIAKTFKQSCIHEMLLIFFYAVFELTELDG